MRIRQDIFSGMGNARAARLLALLLLALVIQIFGCASKGPHPTVTEIQPFTPEERASWESAGEAEYRIQVGDELRVLFKYHYELDQEEITVLPDGRITLPDVSPTRVAGLTLSEVDSTLTAQYAVEYLDPDLSIIIESFGNFGVYVFGEVRRPGLTVLPPAGVKILQVIAQAGGFTDTASAGEVLHVRVTPEGYVYRHLDLSHLEKRDFMSFEAMDLQPYDVIYVPRSGMGDFANFSKQVIGSMLNYTDLFWDIYAIVNLDKVDRLVR